MTPTYVRWAADRVRHHALGPLAAPPPADEHADRVLYGITRPIAGVRLLFGDAELLKAALYPAALLAAACSLAALVLPGHFVVRFYKMFAFLAPVPSLFMASHYARLAALARQRLGYGACDPCIEPIDRALWRIVARAVLITLAVAPLLPLRGVPLLGHAAWKAALALWALHWIVVDAFDSARVLRPKQTLEEADAGIDDLPRPWFVRLLEKGGEQVPFARRFFELLAQICDWLARPWREELALVAAHPSLMVGFALSTALLLATPVLNLLFRPIVTIAAVHVLGRLRPLDA